MSWTNYHSHTHFCDGTDAPETYVEAALALGMPAYGFSGHSPVPFDSEWSMTDSGVVDYLELVQALKEKYADQIQLYVGLEVDFVPGITGVNDYFIANLGLDYTIGSIHFVDAFEDETPWEIDGRHLLFEKGLEEIFNGDIEKAVTRYFELTRQMLNEAAPDVVGHLDKIKMHNSFKPFFSEDDAWYKAQITETLQLIKEKGVILEVNTRGLYKKATTDFYPSTWVLQEAFELDIPVMINSDSHHPKEITSNFDDAAIALQNIGYKTIQVLLDGVWQPKAFTTQGIVL